MSLKTRRKKCKMKMYFARVGACLLLLSACGVNGGGLLTTSFEYVADAQVSLSYPDLQNADSESAPDGGGGADGDSGGRVDHPADTAIGSSGDSNSPDALLQEEENASADAASDAMLFPEMQTQPITVTCYPTSAPGVYSVACGSGGGWTIRYGFSPDGGSQSCSTTSPPTEACAAGAKCELQSATGVIYEGTCQ
jgi:hypothetical protein